MGRERAGQRGRERFALLNRLREVVGEEEARPHLESLPPVHLARTFATKDDDQGHFEAEQTTVVHGEWVPSSPILRTEILRGDSPTCVPRSPPSSRTSRAENQEHRGEVALQFAKQTRRWWFTMLGLTVADPGRRSSAWVE